MMTVEVAELVTSVEEGPDMDVVVMTETVTEIVEIGIAGPQGPPGAPGTAPQSYTHDQAVPASTWSITHNLGFNPNVTVIDTLGRVVEGDIAYPSLNAITLTFSGAFSGKAYLS